MLVSPADAKIDTVFDTNHAISLVTDGGAELLIHIGIDTVRLNGKYFKAMVNKGDRVKTGQPLIEFNIEKIKEEGYDVTTSIVVTNHTNYSKIERNGSRAIEKKPFLLLKGEKK